MPIPIAFLLAVQAAGMVTDYLGTANEQKFSDLGVKAKQAGIEANIEQTRLEAEDASLQSLKALRQNLGTQAAVFAARGTNPGAGSALSFLSDSIGNFNSDERMRRMNLLGKQNELKAGKTLDRLNQQGTNSKLWSGFAQRTINRFPSSPDSFGSSGSAFSGSKAGGFGLTQNR